LIEIKSIRKRYLLRLGHRNNAAVGLMKPMENYPIELSEVSKVFLIRGHGLSV